MQLSRQLCQALYYYRTLNSINHKILATLNTTTALWEMEMFLPLKPVSLLLVLIRTKTKVVVMMGGVGWITHPKSFNGCTKCDGGKFLNCIWIDYGVYKNVKTQERHFHTFFFKKQTGLDSIKVIVTMKFFQKWFNSYCDVCFSCSLHFKCSRSPKRNLAVSNPALTFTFYCISVIESCLLYMHLF